ncbi:MAG TPA: hypothetical protein VE053_06775 [Allosphingosinicella sp.]|nr:hypothetical protein [Allosphingosinicella sp.]
MGRPSSYDTALADDICAKLASGMSLRKICDEDGMPDRETVRRWQMENEDFAAKCARARDIQADEYFDRVLQVVDDVAEGTAKSARVKLAGLQWMASKLAPKRYGDRTTLAGDPDAPFDMKIDATVRFVRPGEVADAG